MATPDTVRRSNIIYSWKSSVHKIDGEPYEGIKSVSFSEKLERKLVHGAKRDATPLGMTGGKYTLESVSITMLKDTANKLKRNLAEKSGNGSYGGVEFNYDLQHVEPGQDPISVSLIGLRLTGNKADEKEGVDESEVQLELMGLRAVEKCNGTTVSLYSDEDSP
jgi:hypothetical protein